MIVTFTSTSPSEAASVHGGSSRISDHASLRSTSRRKSQRNTIVAVNPRSSLTAWRRSQDIPPRVVPVPAIGQTARVAARHFDGRREVAIGLGVYAAYLLVRQAKLRRQGRAKAERNADRLVALERVA